MEIERYGEVCFCGWGFGSDDFIISYDSPLGKDLQWGEKSLVFLLPLSCIISAVYVVTQETVLSFSKLGRKKPD